MCNSTSVKLGEDNLPNFMELLSEKDKIEYFKLRSALDVTCGKRNRGHRVEAFDGILSSIREYIEKSDKDDWKRSLVCGVCWMENMIAINTRQLRFLITKCKSSINGSLQRMGYLTNQSHAESWKLFISKIPFLKDNYSELRQWTIRCKTEPVQQQYVATPILPVEINYSPIPVAHVNTFLPNYCIHPVAQPNNIVIPIYTNNFFPAKVGLNAMPQPYPSFIDISNLCNNHNYIPENKSSNFNGNMTIPNSSSNDKKSFPILNVSNSNSNNYNNNMPNVS